jgi:hypothetical protein
MAPAQVVRAHIAPTIGVVTPLDQDTCELVTGSNSFDEVALYVGLIGHEFVVHDPPELREHLAKLGSRLSRGALHPRPGRGT